MSRLMLIGVAVFAAVTASAVDFSRGKWNRDDFFVAKSARFPYFNAFVQEDDCIVNPCPNVPDKEIVSKKYCDSVYTAMLLKEKVGIGKSVSSTMSWDYEMAPLIVLAPELGKDAEGRPEFREHWEIVLYKDGINVWHHGYADGKPNWFKAASVKAHYQAKTKYELKVKVTVLRNGHKQMAVTCGDLELTYVDDALPDEFYAGIIGCEGRNRFYDFNVGK